MYLKYSHLMRTNPGALPLERRGCNFSLQDPIRAYSDVGNWRVYTEFTTADGVDVCGDFGRGYVYDTTGRNPIKTSDHALSSNLCYYDNDGVCRGFRLNTDGLEFTIADILAAVNSVSAVQYDRIIWVDSIEAEIPASGNFTPSGIMIAYSKRYRIPYDNAFGMMVMHTAFGDYKYHSYRVHGTSVTIILESI